MRWFSGFGGGRLFQKLELSDDQVEKISELKEDSFAKFAHGKIDGLQLHQQLFKELSREKIDRQKVLSIAEQLKKHKAQMTDLLVLNMLSFAEVLTAEQRKKLKDLGMKQFLQGGMGAEHRHSHHCHRCGEHGHHEHQFHEHEHHGHECSHEDDPDEMQGPPPPPPPPPPPKRGGAGFGRRH